MKTGIDGTGPESCAIAGVGIGGVEPVASVASVVQQLGLFCFQKAYTFFSPQQTYTSGSTVWSGRLHQYEEILLFSNRNAVV